MNRLSCTITLLLFSLFTFAQEIVSTIPILIKNKIDVFQVTNDFSKQTLLFIPNKDTFNTIRLDSSMNVIDSLVILKPKNTADKIIGDILSSDKCTLFWQSSSKNKIISQVIDLRNKRTVNKDISIEYKNEIHLKRFSSGNKFYILTLMKNSNKLKLNIISEEGDLTTKELDLSFAKLYHRSNLYEIFEEDLMPSEQQFSLEEIDIKSPISLINSSKKRKFYVVNNQLNITIDTDQNYTQWIQIDLNNFIISSKNILQTASKFFGTTDLKYNSILFENKLFQIKSSSEKLYLTVKDNNGEFLKELVSTNDQPSDFGALFNNQRTNQENLSKIKNSHTFIKKINKLDIALSCYQLGKKTILTIGGISPPSQTIDKNILNQFGLVGAIIGELTKPALDNFNSYANRDVVKIDMILDEENNRINYDLSPLAFDKIQRFVEKNTNLSSYILYQFNKTYYLGSFNIDDKKYTIRKFED